MREATEREARAAADVWLRAQGCSPLRDDDKVRGWWKDGAVLTVEIVRAAAPISFYGVSVRIEGE